MSCGSTEPFFLSPSSLFPSISSSLLPAFSFSHALHDNAETNSQRRLFFFLLGYHFPPELSSRDDFVMLSCLSHFHIMYRKGPARCLEANRRAASVPCAFLTTLSSTLHSPTRTRKPGNKYVELHLPDLSGVACKCCIIVTKVIKRMYAWNTSGPHRASRNGTFVNCSSWICAQMRSRVVVLF